MMTNKTSDTVERAEAIERMIADILAAYHTTRLADCPAPKHIRVKLGDKLEAAITAHRQAPPQGEADLRSALDLAAGRLRWFAEHEPGSRPDVAWKWANEAEQALSRKPAELSEGGAS